MNETNGTEKRRQNIFTAIAVAVVLIAAIGGLLLGMKYRKNKQTADAPTGNETSTAATETTVPYAQTSETIETTTSEMSSTSSTASTESTAESTTSAVSAEDKLAVPANPSCSIYENPIEGVSVVFTWDRVPGASGYELSVTETKYYGETYANVYDVDTNKYMFDCSDYGTMDCRVRAYKKHNGGKEFSEWSTGFTSSDSVIPGVHAEFCTRYGQINTHGAKSVYGYTAQYVANNGTEEIERNDLQNGWHVTGNAYLDSRGVRWYMLYDTDDGDYYGWVDETYIDWYDSANPVSEANDVSGIERAYSDYLLSIMATDDYIQRKNDSFDEYMYDLVDINQDGSPELIISHGETYSSGFCEVLAYVNGQCKQLLPYCGCYGVVSYHAGYKFLCDGYGHMGVASYDYYSFDGNTLNLVDNFSMEPDSSDYEQSVYKHNGAVITADDFSALLDKYSSSETVGRKYHFPDNPSTNWAMILP